MYCAKRRKPLDARGSDCIRILRSGCDWRNQPAKTAPPRLGKCLMLEKLVGFCLRWPWLIVLSTLALTGGGAYFTATRFAIDTDTAHLFSSNIPWRKNEAALYKAFPQLSDLIVAVIDGATPEKAEDAAKRLNAALQGAPMISRSWRPDDNEFFRTNGLLFLTTPEAPAHRGNADRRARRFAVGRGGSQSARPHRRCPEQSAAGRRQPTRPRDVHRRTRRNVGRLRTGAGGRTSPRLLGETALRRLGATSGAPLRRRPIRGASS